MVGKLLYLTITRPDIYYDISHLSQFLSSPTQGHYLARIKLLKNIKKAPSQGILYKRDVPLQLHAFYDADWTDYPISRKSISGFTVLLCGSAIIWKSKNKLLCPSLLLRVSIGPWHLLYVKLCGYIIYWLISRWNQMDLHCSTITTKQPYTLPLTLCSMSAPSTSKLTATWCVITFKQISLNYDILHLMLMLLIYSPNRPLLILCNTYNPSWAFTTSMLQLEGGC